jgi:hypothetical protein
MVKVGDKVKFASGEVTILHAKTDNFGRTYALFLWERERQFVSARFKTGDREWEHGEYYRDIFEAASYFQLRLDTIFQDA